METMNFEDLNKGNDNQAAPSAPHNKNKKLIWTGIIMAVLILTVVGWQYWQYINSPYYQQIKAVKELEKLAKESDKWGGKTPEETVRLFTEAVKKGDFELASKYGNPELITPKIEQIKNENKLNVLIRGLEIGKVQIFIGGNDANLMVEENGQKFRVLSMHKSESGTWKIDEF